MLNEAKEETESRTNRKKGRNKMGSVENLRRKQLYLFQDLHGKYFPRLSTLNLPHLENLEKAILFNVINSYCHGIMFNYFGRSK